MEKVENNFRHKTENLVTNNYFIVTLIIVCFVLFLLELPGTLLFYIVIPLTLWAKRWEWSYLGFTKPNWKHTASKAVLFTFVLLILSDFLILPILELNFGRVDLSGVDHIIGNWGFYILYILLGWIVGGFGEEIIYRGYVTKRLAIILGDTNKTWLLSVIISSFGFGIAHFWQGITGIINASFVSLLLGLIFSFNRNNLMLLVLIHGFYDTIAITLIFLGKASLITDYIIDLIN
jgi:membrane protease YdiL (CAAX protease family)